MKLIFFLSCFINGLATSAQDISYNRKIVDTLTSKTFWGRGYTKNGMGKAADFLAKEFGKIGLTPFSQKSFLQRFAYSANTFPGKMEVAINDQKLIPGVDFIVSAGSAGVKAKGTLVQKDSVNWLDDKHRILVSTVKKLTWSASQKVEDYTLIQVDEKRMPGDPRKIKVHIENEFIFHFGAANVTGFVKGTTVPDSFIFITAHYDHLGGMGSNTYFPGANDNASGDALLLSMAKYFFAHPQRYSVGFILFAGEEAGLVGSKYYVDHPIIPLNKIRFLINTDLAGTGEDGITVVNATEFPTEFALMNKINDENKYLKSIGARGKAANSDHYFFSENGVPAFFFYTKGGIAAYHDIFDKSETLPLTEQADLQQLLIKFVGGLQK